MPFQRKKRTEAGSPPKRAIKQKAKQMGARGRVVSPSTKIAVLASGGFDSNVLISELLRSHASVYPVYVRCGLVWEKAEIHWLIKYLNRLKNRKLKPLTVLDLPVADFDRKGWSVTGRGTPDRRSHDREVFLLGRNLLLLSKAATFCASKKIPRIALGTLGSNPFPDATPDFFRHFEKTAGMALGFPIKILTPFARLKKSQVARKAEGLPLHLSFSCLAPRGTKPCGRCNKCAELEALLDG